MEFIEDDKPQVEHIYFDDYNNSIDAGIQDEVRLGTKRDMQPGRCAYFDGTNKVAVTVPAITKDVCIITGWFKLTGTATGKFFLSDNTSVIRTLYYNNGQIRFYYGDIGGSNYINVTGKSYNVWYHFAIVTSKAAFPAIGGQSMVYINNIREGLGAGNNRSASDIWAVPATYNLGGWRTADGYTNAGTCTIFDFRVHECDNNVAAIEQVITNSYAFVPTNNLAHCKLDEGTGAIAYDSSGNGRHGTWTGLVASSHYTGSDVPYSYQNEVGYGKGETALGVSLNKSVNSGTLLSFDGEWFDFKGASTSNELAVCSHSEILAVSKFPQNEGVKITFEVKDYVSGGTNSIRVLFGTGSLSTYILNTAANGTHTVILPRGTSTGDTITFGYYGNSQYSFTGKIKLVKVEGVTLRPRNEANPTKDVLGNTLTYQGKAPVAVKAKGSHCGYFNGTHYVTDTKPKEDYNFIPRTGIFDISFYASFDNGASTSAVDTLVTTCWSGSGIRVAYGNNYSGVQKLIYVLTSGGIMVAKSKATITDTLVHFIRITCDGVNVKIYIDNVESTEVLSPWNINNGAVSEHTLVIGNSTTVTTMGHKGLLFGVSVKNNLGFEMFYAPFSEGGGSTVHNVVGTTHGTVTGDATIFWSKTQDVFHYNLTKGFNFPTASCINRTDFGATENATNFYAKGITDVAGSIGVSMSATTGQRYKAENGQIVFYTSGLDTALWQPRLGSSQWLVTPSDYFNRKIKVTVTAQVNAYITEFGISIEGANRANGGNFGVLTNGIVTHVTEFNMGTSAGYNVQWWVRGNALGEGKATILSIKAEITSKTPAKNSTHDVYNNLLSNPAGNWYNYPETALDFSGGIASPYSLKVPTNWKGENTAPNLTAYFRDKKVSQLLLRDKVVKLTEVNRAKDYAKDTKQTFLSLTTAAQYAFGATKNSKAGEAVTGIFIGITYIPSVLNARQDLITKYGADAANSLFTIRHYEGQTGHPKNYLNFGVGINGMNTIVNPAGPQSTANETDLVIGQVYKVTMRGVYNTTTGAWTWYFNTNGNKYNVPAGAAGNIINNGVGRIMIGGLDLNGVTYYKASGDISNFQFGYDGSEANEIAYHSGKIINNPEYLLLQGGDLLNTIGDTVTGQEYKQATALNWKKI